ncbi:hypothetical protein O1611_g4766 [Lasiodiplodia mahajangana]|uniref:Uncharacterized protein n=1 Tax=Lasiodiplodia mahajangana TaxID=1108764 RepID=A0ACC2JNG3_9PEZI|nr:hypothetical protein O1611_g4766 [Lasiodiplodia mahajangana]
MKVFLVALITGAVRNVAGNHPATAVRSQTPWTCNAAGGVLVSFENDMSILHTRFPDLNLYVDTPSHGFPPSYSIMFCLATAEFVESDFGSGYIEQQARFAISSVTWSTKNLTLEKGDNFNTLRGKIDLIRDQNNRTTATSIPIGTDRAKSNLVNLEVNPAVGVDEPYRGEFMFTAENPNPVFTPCFNGRSSIALKFDFDIYAYTVDGGVSSGGWDVDFNLIYEKCHWAPADDTWGQVKIRDYEPNRIPAVLIGYTWGRVRIGAGLFGGEITSIETTLVSNYNASVPAAYRYTAPSVELTNATFCNVTVTYTHPGQDDEIHIEAWLPTNTWNERFLAVGGGGWVAGRFFLSYANMQGALADGYATITTDAGLGSATDAEPWGQISLGNVNLYNVQNLASVSLNDEALIGKQLIKSYYGKGPLYSYWNGCSQGGRQGMMLAQRYPDAYDGIAAAAPAIYWTELGPSTTWPQQVMSMAGHYPYNCEADALTTLAVMACDKLDRVEDGIISRPQECLAHFDPFRFVGMSINCTQTNGTVRITHAAASLVNETWHGPRAVDGTKLWHGMSPGADITGDFSATGQPGLGSTNCTGTTCTGATNVLGEWTQLFVSKNPTLDLLNLTHKEWESLFYSSGQQYRSLIGSGDPDLRAFSKRGGKLLSFHGVQDNTIPLGSSLQYYNAVASISPDIHNFFRLFEVPGLGHCFGGRSEQPSNLFAQLRQWVENGTAPETTPVNVTDTTGFQVLGARVLCPYPQQQQLVKGCTDTSAAKCWSCTKRN